MLPSNGQIALSWMLNGGMEDRPIFPDPPAVTVERTLAIIKPDAVEYADEIIEEINRAGFTILQVKYVLWLYG